MGFQLPDDLVPELQFSPEEEQTIVDLADRIVAETLQCSEEFIAGGRRLSKQEWKLIKSREQLQVYKKRREKEGTPQRPRLLSGTLLENHLQHNNYSHNDGSDHGSQRQKQHSQQQHAPPVGKQLSISVSSTSDRDSESGFGESVVEGVKPAHVPLFIAHGVVPGTVDDFAFGSLANSEYTWRLRNSYVQETSFDGTMILATLHGPTEDDPFRFLGVKWLSTGVGAFLSRRDFVYIEATGMALDANGERVSYELIHSVELKELPELRQLDVIRGRFSKCVISRQHDAASVEVYCRSFLDLRGEVLESLRLNLHSESVLTIANLVECSYVKKLTWQMQRSRRSASQVEKHAPVKHCEMCDKSLRNLGNLFQSGLACQICRKMMCAKCSVEKKVTVDISDEVTQKMLAFCLPCVINAKKLSAWDIAVANL